ncbi:Bax inhibitor-1/YccA family protein [Olleya aquimaris]|uniref:Putative YccA/Bax inhibitor family protein n=1 Tax=Olleya aquimaris TaxID=639310 RepID=A0A327RP89_9FLAO|nr:Bax inhibitor-1/YccA family protein [Olleya aquimaris]RAJ18155.1 putative YccA/Bax inhibitor family protein [Olleya aquimaris]
MGYLDKTSNPAFSNYFWNNNSGSYKKLTVSGILLKTLFCLLVITSIVVAIWKLYANGTNIKWFATGGMLAAIVISIVISVRQHWAHILVPLYAVAKGFFLGGITAYAQASFPNLPYQAIGVTLVTFFVVLFLYQTRLIVVTNKVRSVIITVCTSIFVVYLISWILGFFGIKSFIWGTSWLAIGFNIFAAIFAALSLLLDFDYIERQKNKAPKYKEWMATWGLLVTIVWLYVEILRLMKKFAIRF